MYTCTCTLHVHTHTNTYIYTQICVKSFWIQLSPKQANVHLCLTPWFVLVTIWYTQKKRLWFKEKERCWARFHGIKGQWRHWRKTNTNDAYFWTKCFVEVLHTKEWQARVYRLCLCLCICVCVACALVQMLHWAVDKAARCQQCGVLKSCEPCLSCMRALSRWLSSKISIWLIY